MNGELKKRVVAIIDGAKADPDEKLDLLLGLTLDTHSVVERNEGRITDLEVYPATVKRVGKFLGGLGVLVSLLVGGAKLFGLL